MPRTGRDRLPLDDAVGLCGERKLRSLAATRQSYSNWRTRGIPWEVIGPLLVEQLSLASVAHSQLARHGGPDMHAVLDVQGRVWQLARAYGIDSKEFQAVHQLLTLYVPDGLARANVPERSEGLLSSNAAGLPRDGAARTVRTIKKGGRMK